MIASTLVALIGVGLATIAGLRSTWSP